MKRIVQPEILDTLPPDDPDAIASRRDLRLINEIMGNQRWIANELLSSVKPSDRILEIGAGSGDFGRFLHSKHHQEIPHYCGLDLCSRPPDWPDEWEWIQEDVTEFDRFGDFTILIANLILHHFENTDLERLGKKLNPPGLRLIIANETARHRLHQWQLQLMRPLKLNHVTRHDGHVSIRAGFREEELPALLGLRKPDWQNSTTRTFRGAMRMIARKAGDPLA